jgi:adenine-specific DNA glycosylase
LGLFYRAERLISIAQFIVSNCNGIIPDDLDELKKLKE